jgi:hypothetical protein
MKIMNKMKKKTLKSLVAVLSIALLSVVVLGGASVVKAGGSVGVNWDKVEAEVIKGLIKAALPQPLEGILGASGTRFPNGISADSTSPSAGEVRGTTLTSTGAATVGGDLTLTGNLVSTEPLVTVSAIVASTTLTVAQSGTTFVFTTSTEFVLPATSTASGVSYKFKVGGALETTNVTIRTSDLGDNIEGTLIVAGAVVDCDAEDVITFVVDGENIGDYVELFSDGTYWYIGDSGALTASKLTCSAT